MTDPSSQLVSDIPSKRIIDLSKTKLTNDEALDCLTNDQVEVVLPNPSVKACNNLDEYFLKSTNKTKVSTKKISPNQEPLAVPLVRNFDRILKKKNNSDGSETTSLLIHRPRKTQQDVFQKVAKVSDNSSLVFLKNRLNRKIKVVIRRRRKCPYISRVLSYKGQLVLFDKHMNLYLDDVIESFAYHPYDKLIKRARHRKSIMLRGDNIIMIS